MSTAEIMKKGMDCLIQNLGIIETEQFISVIIREQFDYTKWQREYFDQIPKEELDPIQQGKAALTQLFNQVRNTKTPVIVERIVNDIDDIVRVVRFPGWQNTPTGRREVSRNLRDVVMRRYRIKDKEVFDKAYSYVEQYY